MKKLITCLLVFVFVAQLNAQTPESTKKVFEPMDIYHGVTTGITANNPGSHAGYYLDLHMRKRLWLFTKYNIHYYTYGIIADDRTAIALAPSVCFAFRLNGEDKRWNYFPYLGTAINLATYSRGNWLYQNNSHSSSFDINLVPTLMAGFEAKCRLKDKYNLGLGVEVDSYNGDVRGFVKFGWNRQYKNK